jgi:hypothetical protein
LKTRLKSARWASRNEPQTIGQKGYLSINAAAWLPPFRRPERSGGVLTARDGDAIFRNIAF